MTAMQDDINYARAMQEHSVNVNEGDADIASMCETIVELEADRAMLLAERESMRADARLGANVRRMPAGSRFAHLHGGGWVYRDAIPGWLFGHPVAGTTPDEALAPLEVPRG